MAHISKDRIKETTTTTGTGALTLAGAVSGFRAFSAVMTSPSDTCHYTIEDTATGAWETGLGTYTGANTLARTTVYDSSNVGALVSFAAGTKTVFIDAPASALPIFQPDNGLNMPEIAAGTTPTTPPAGFTKVNSRLIANRPTLGIVDDGGHQTFVQPSMAHARVGTWLPAGNSAGLPGVHGLIAPTTVATLTARNVATTNAATRMRRLGLVSATTTAGSFASIYHNAALQYTCGSGSKDGSGFHLSMKWVPSNAASVSGERRFVGIQASTAAPTNVEPSALTDCIGVAQLSTDATQLYIVYGGSAAQTAIALGSTNFPGNTLSTTAFQLDIWAPWYTANTYYVQVTNLNNGAIATQTLTGAATVVPQSTTLTNWRAWACNNATALGIAVDIGSVYVETTN